jgi:SsrA-binding protein
MANIKTVADNKKARFNYEIIETYEAGLELTGPEVKSIKAGHVSLREAYASVENGELWLKGAHVSAYKPAALNNAEPTRNRKLILKKSEIDHLTGKVQAEGYTLVPTKVYLTHGLIKVEIALAKGKKLWSKKEAIKKRDISRDISRELKER